jgi:hypothetical protein
MVKDTYILQKSDRKGKRFVIIMPSFGHKHHFASDVGQTFIDHQDEDKKKAWISRHKNDKGFNSKHSGIYHSRKLLWEEPTLKKAIKKYEKEHNVKIVMK